MPISQTEGYFENTWYRFLEELMLFLLVSKFIFQYVQNKKAFWRYSNKSPYVCNI